MGMLVTLMLMIVNMFTTTLTLMPSSEETTAIEIWYMIVISQGRIKIKKQKIYYHYLFQCQILLAMFEYFVILYIIMKDKDKVGDKNRKKKKIATNWRAFCTRLDTISFFFCPVLFAFENCIYWLYYSSL